MHTHAHKFCSLKFCSFSNSLDLFSNGRRSRFLLHLTGLTFSSIKNYKIILHLFSASGLLSSTRCIPIPTKLPQTARLSTFFLWQYRIPLCPAISWSIQHLLDIWIASTPQITLRVAIIHVYNSMFLYLEGEGLTRGSGVIGSILTRTNASWCHSYFLRNLLAVFHRGWTRRRYNQ